MMRSVIGQRVEKDVLLGIQAEDIRKNAMEDMLLEAAQIQIMIRMVLGAIQAMQIGEITGNTVILLVRTMIFVAINLHHFLQLLMINALKQILGLNAG